MLHRVHDGRKWIICEPTTEGHVPDSGVHRYDRVHGFAVTAEELEMMGRNLTIAQAERRARNANKQKSHMQTVMRWAVFERNAGRWRSMLILAKYLAQGAMQREAYEDDEEGPQEDPIFKVFVFKKVTSAAASGLDIM